MSKKVQIRIYKSIILPAVLYGCDTWPVAFREEHGLRAFVKSVLRRIYGPRRERRQEE
jgi:hypothetical protein